MSARLYGMVDCKTCGGAGVCIGFRRFVGEYQAGEPVELRCLDCDGSGEVEAVCAECGKREPLDDDGECERCSDAHELPVAEFDAKYGLTETRGDPLLAKNRRVA